MAYGEPSGTTNYVPLGSDLVLDAYERCSIYSLESKHMFSARRSANLLLTSKWSNVGINLWKIDESPTVIPLAEGIVTYQLTSDVIAMFDTYRRQYQMNTAVSQNCAFSTTINTPDVTVDLGDTSVAVGSYLGFPVQVSVGGIIVYGFYKVTATPTATSATFTAATDATATVVSGGVVPVFSTTADSTSVNVELPDHGYVSGEPFVVAVSTTVGGIQLFGSYTIASVVDADNFTIAATSPALSTGSAAENAGQCQVSTQNVSAPPIDILMTPISRNDYAAQSNKLNPGAPTTYWYQKLITPQFNLWPVTDGTGPYELRTYCMRQIQDFNPMNGQTLDMPQRLWYAFTLDLARDLAMKFAQKMYALLKAEAQEAWDDASATDVENTSTFMVPNFPTGL